MSQICHIVAMMSITILMRYKNNTASMYGRNRPYGKSMETPIVARLQGIGAVLLIVEKNQRGAGSPA
jgi:hypothetical protein